MTLGDAKRKVYMLLDEYSSGGSVTTDADIEKKMADFFDMAVKDIAIVEKPIDYYEITRITGQTEYDMPSDFRQMRRVWRDGVDRTSRYKWRNKTITIPEEDTGDIEVEYFKTPETIAQNAADSTVLDCSEEAAVACCYYVASKQLIVDLVIDYSALEAIYQQMKQQCARNAAGFQGRIAQNLFRRG